MSWTPDPPGPPPSAWPPPGGPPPGAWQPQAGYGPSGPVEHPQGTTVLVLGLLAWVACAITGPFAWSMGNKALREIDANPTAYSNRTMVVVGRVLGIVATILGGLAIVGFGALIVLAVFVGTTTEPEVRELDAVVRGLRTVSGR